MSRILSSLFVAILLLMLNRAFAQNVDDALSYDFLAGTHVKHANLNNAGGLHGKGNIPTPHGFPQGVDTIANFTDHFESQGFYFDGSPHHVWEYSMVGSNPAQGGTTTYNAPVVPVSLDLRNADGSIRLRPSRRHALHRNKRTWLPPTLV